MFLIGALFLVGLSILLYSLVNKPCTVYLAQPMTGYDKPEMIQLAKQAVFIAESYGLKPWSPVLQEGVAGRGKLKADGTLLSKWDMDKEALNKCFIFVNLNADNKSFGCENEYGRHRYSEWQPAFLISPKHDQGYVSIANYQADGIFGDMHRAFKHMSDNFGHLHQRQLFKLHMFITKGPRWMGRQLHRLWQ